MRILLLESFYASSHKQWVDGLIAHTQYEIELLSMPGRHWKWRMEQSAIYFADRIEELTGEHELIICSDLCNVAVLKGLLGSKGDSKSWYRNSPIILYFHENQITYPWSATDPDILSKRDNHYGWINYLSCLAADHVVFNSDYHKSIFNKELVEFVGQFPDELPEEKLADISQKSCVLHIGIDLAELMDKPKVNNDIPIVLWNHRWEYDKNPEVFFETLFSLADEGIDFQLIVAGEKYKRYPEIFDIAKRRLENRIIHFGYAKSRAEYLSLLLMSDIIPVTSNQDFFGISAIEAISCGAYPILPDRLAFSEHIDLETKERYYYKTDDELMSMLRKLLVSRMKLPNDVRTHVGKYDWSQLILKYDQFFQEVVDLAKS